MTTKTPNTKTPLAGADDRHVVVTWKPTHQPVTVVHVRSNGELVVHDKRYAASPAEEPLGAPDGGQYTIGWSISPEVKVDELAIEVVRPSSGARVTIDTTGPKERKETWSNSQGVTVNAP